jgi:hypothetical protein
MKEADLNDPDPDEWEYGFRGDIHFLLIIADDDKGKVFTAAEALKTEIEMFGSVTTIEYGNALRNAAKRVSNISVMLTAPANRFSLKMKSKDTKRITLSKATSLSLILRLIKHSCWWTTR